MRLLLILLLTLNLLQAKKIALLIGNNDYSFQPLSNPLHDVDGIYKTLIEIGFKKSDIKVLKNASKTEMESELANFSQRATSAEIALVYFSGHGMQVNNTNYMFPARTTATKPIHLRTLVDLDYFIESASSAKYGIVLVDACRNNPLVKYFQNGKHKGAVAKKGLGQVTPTVGQVVIGFATSAGDTADDGNGRMSPYAEALANRLKENDDVRNVLGKVAKDVSSKYEQSPIYKSNLAKSIFLRSKNKKIKEICPSSMKREGNHDVCYTIRLGKNYLFFDNFSSHNTIKFKHYDVTFNPDTIYNKRKGPNFYPTNWVKSNKYILKSNIGEKKIIGSNKFYKIKTIPFNNKRSYNNIRIYYKLDYVDYIDGKEIGKVKTNVDVAHYAISWCGDGVIDTQYGEECEPLKSAYACSKKCKLLSR